MNYWDTVISRETRQPYLGETLDYIALRRSEGITVLPSEQHIFSAFEETPFEELKVVILGQDPYHGLGQAHGLCFSVLPDIKPPPSLVNIYKELAQDITDFTIPAHGYLLPWAKQGVLLLNTVLSVEQGKAHSHKHLGWEKFTDVVINEINQHAEGVVFLLWGAHAQKKGKHIDETRHHVLHAPHPSPLSAHRGFFGCSHFSKANQILSSMSKTKINWQV